MDIDQLLGTPITQRTGPWEKVVRKLALRQMPPAEMPHPTESEYEAMINELVTTLDRHAAEHPNPGQTETLRRLNRTEYRNAIRDLLALDVDVSELLPADEASHGFDNITVTGLSPVLLDRYVSAARLISRQVIGHRAEQAAERTYRIRPDVTQDKHLAGTPIGTRGGTVVRHHFPQAGEYEIQAWLMRDRNEELEGLRGQHELEFLVDRDPVATFTIKRPEGQSDKLVDAKLTARVTISAGPHDVTVAFLKNPSSLQESVRQPLNVHFNYYRHPRIEPAVYQITIRGPFAGQPAGDTPSRQRVFVCYPQDPAQDRQCAETILTHVAQRAYRRPPTADDIQPLLTFFDEGNRDGGFELGIERALSAILVSPYFLFHIERTPPETPRHAPYQVPPLELASRLAFFLWSSLPDDELLTVAIDGRLQQPEVLHAQVRRMLADERSASLANNFASQWLYLRNLDSVIPDMRLFPDFDDNLRQALRQETELFFQHVVQDDRSVLDLIRADHSYLNERLAKHYGVAHIYGSHFRRVELDDASHRGGLLRHGSILTVTSYATRTSPVKRGNWVLENLLGSPPPAPPPNVPALEETTVSATSVRARLEQHRANPACASCHNIIDPIGYALDNYDALGRWRDTEAGESLDVAGNLPDGSTFEGVPGLEEALLQRPELFITTLTEKLMTFGLGRGLEPDDASAVRKIVRDARDSNYQFSDIILGIAQSV
ncbi:MAG: DUF1592 domain-containing protein, partial [Planctomycetales bacterium]|nr:DUF1592 domain-containing protein [Planctomycetales bacterium]